jgi:hypothetical protein
MTVAAPRLTDDQARALGLGDLIPKRASRATADPDGMNKTERRYANKLEEMKVRGIIRGYWFEPVKFRLAGKTFYTPDFMVESHSGVIWFVETKGGFIRDDAMVKLKVVAEHMPFAFYLAQWVGREWKQSFIGRGPS